MSADPHYVYGQGQSSRSSYPILLGTVTVEVIGYKERRYRPNWRRIGLLFPVFLLLLWVALSEANYFKERFMNGIPTTRRADMYLYLPDTAANTVANLFLDKEEIRLRERAKLLSAKDSYGRSAHLYRKGEYFVSVAKEALTRQDYAEFARYIGTGAQLSPANLEAQRLCADLFFVFQRPLDAYQLLEESLVFAKQDREYFRYYVQRCFMLDQDARLIATATKHLADPAVAEEIRADLRLAAAQAHFLRGDFADAARLIKEHRLDQTADGYLLNCQLLWESGDREGALAELDAALAVFPAGVRLLEMKARWLKDSGDFRRAQDTLDLLSISQPGRPGPLIQSLYLLPGEANRARREALLEKIVATFGNQEQPMLDLARFGNDTADVALTARLAKLALERKFGNRVRFDLVHVECLLNAGRARETILLVDALYKQAERDQWVGRDVAARRLTELLGAGAEDVVGDRQHAPRLHHEVTATDETARVSGARLVEGLGNGRPPFDDHRIGVPGATAGRIPSETVQAFVPPAGPSDGQHPVQDRPHTIRRIAATNRV